MRKFGCILLCLGFVWVCCFAVGTGALLRAIDTNHHTEQLSYTSIEFAEVSHFALTGIVGGFLMLAGGIILGTTAAPKKPPIL
jgi:hypothetical protein